MELKEVAVVLFRRKYWIVAFVGGSLLVAVLGFHLRAPSYQASAQLLVKLGREISTPSQDILEAEAYVIQKRREDIYAEVEILQSLHLLERVVEEVGEDKVLAMGEEVGAGWWRRVLFFPVDVFRWTVKVARAVLSPAAGREVTPFERAVMQLRAGLRVEAVIRSDTIRVAYSDEDTALAREILETFLNSYLERHIEVHKGAGLESLFTPQASYYREQLAAVEKRLAELKERRNIFALDTQRTELIRQRGGLRVELEDTEREIGRKERKVKRIEEQMSSESGIVELPELEDQNPVIDTLRNRLVELELEKQQLVHNYSPESRKVKNLQAEINGAREQLNEEHGRILFTNRKDLEVLRDRAEALRLEIRGYVKELEEINGVEAEKNQLEREREINEKNYLRYAREVEEVRISDAMDLARVTNVRVIQPVTVAVRPEGPRNSLILLVTTCMSLLASIGIVFVLDYFDHSIKTARDVERFLELPVLGSIREGRGQA